MPTATNSSDSLRARCIEILVGYNLPFVLWTGLAVLVSAIDVSGFWRCPAAVLLGWCPGCGLTWEYMQLLTGQGSGNLWVTIVLAAFLANAAVSVAKVGRTVTRCSVDGI